MASALSSVICVFLYSFQSEIEEVLRLVRYNCVMMLLVSSPFAILNPRFQEPIIAIFLVFVFNERLL